MKELDAITIIPFMKMGRESALLENVSVKNSKIRDQIVYFQVPESHFDTNLKYFWQILYEMI